MPELTTAVAKSCVVAESLARSLVSQGFGLRSLEPASGDLEAFFLRLTSGGAPEAS